MRKLTAVAAALGLLGAAVLTPVFAAPASDGAAQNDVTAPAKPKKAKTSKAKKGAKAKAKTKKPEVEKQGSQLGSTDLSAAKKKKGKKAKAKKSAAPKEKSSGVIFYRVAA